MAFLRLFTDFQRDPLFLSCRANVYLVDDVSLRLVTDFHVESYN